MSAVELRLVQARGCDNGDASDDRHRRQSAKGPLECGCTLRIAANALPPFVRGGREQRRALVGHPTRKSERGPDAFDFARGCGGFTTRHGIARRSRTPYGIDASESPWVVRLLTAPHVLSRVAGGPAQVLGYSVGCYRNAHKMFGSFEDLVTDLSVYLFCMQDDLSCPPSRQLSGFFDDRRL